MISKKTKYAINALKVLADANTKEPLSTLDIASRGHIPKKFLETILLELKAGGYVTSRRGKAGGYLLLMNPKDINFADLMRLFDGPIGLLPCVTHKYYEPCEECIDEVTCGIRSVFKEVRDVTVAILKDRTLDSILKKEGQLKDWKAKGFTDDL